MGVFSVTLPTSGYLGKIVYGIYLDIGKRHAIVPHFPHCSDGVWRSHRRNKKCGRLNTRISSVPDKPFVDCSFESGVPYGLSRLGCSAAARFIVIMQQSKNTGCKPSIRFPLSGVLPFQGMHVPARSCRVQLYRYIQTWSLWCMK